MAYSLAFASSSRSESASNGISTLSSQFISDAAKTGHTGQ